MLKKILTYGAIAGVIAGAPLSAMVVVMKGHPPLRYGVLLGYLIMLIALSSIFLAIKRHRDGDLGGVIRFWPAFGMGLGISVVAGVLYVLTWETAVAATHMDFASGYAKAMIAEQQAKGVTGEALAQFTAQMEQFKIQYANPLYRLPMVFAEIFPVGLLVSLVSAASLRNSRFMPAPRSPEKSLGPSS